MGRVFKAMHTTMDRVVAVKVILPGVLKDHCALDLFRREVRAAAQLHHPNIAAAYDANEVKGIRFLAMEYVNGPSLQNLVRQHGPLPIGLACELMRQAATALHYAHEQGMVHRDIKPANLLVAHLDTLGRQEDSQTGSSSRIRKPLVKVVDFGLARVRSAAGSDVVDTLKAEPGAVFGTVDYISPEQAHDIHAVDIRGDLYSLGCAFYFALTGQPPFPGGNAVEKLLKHLMNEPQPLRAVRPDVPPAVEALVHRLMAMDPDCRFQTPAELAWALSSLFGTIGRGGTLAAAAVDAPTQPSVVLAGPGEATAPPKELDDDAPTTPLAPLPDALPSPSDDTIIREKLRQWTAIVKFTLYRRGGVSRINREAFRRLQQELVRACHMQASAAPEGRREFYERLEQLLQSWFNPEALTTTDLEIHYQLINEFQQAERQLDTLIDARGPKDDQSTFGSFFTFFKKRRAQQDLKDLLRDVFGVNL